MFVSSCYCHRMLLWGGLCCYDIGIGNLEFEKPNMLRIILYTVALVLLLTALAFYAHFYDRSGTSKAGVPEALG